MFKVSDGQRVLAFFVKEVEAWFYVWEFEGTYGRTLSIERVEISFEEEER